MTEHSRSDEELAQMALDGTDSAFEILVNRYTPVIYRIALGITGTPEEAQDVVQETLLKAFTHLKHFCPEKGSFKVWILTIARNKSINVYSYLKRKAVSLFSDDDSEKIETDNFNNLFVGSGENQESLMVIQQEYNSVVSALGKLPKRQKAALLLKVQENLSYEEIAVVMDASPSSVESLIFRARRKLTEILGK